MSKPPAGGERRRRHDRRVHGERRRSHHADSPWRYATWPDQRLQFATRLFFTLVGWFYFNHVFHYTSPWLSAGQMNAFLLTYGVWVVGGALHAWRRPHSPMRYRLAMWADAAGISVAVLNDPFVVPLSAMVYVLVVLGNGMRYGMRLFAESLLACLLGSLAALLLRYGPGPATLSPGVVVLYVFGAIILLYAYVLMRRIDRSQRRLEHSSRIDPLTGLMNRGALKEVAGACLSELGEGECAVVMFADLDKFKAINDTHGHAAGDRVLSEVARIIRRSLRESDIAARYGGDEFVLLVRDVDLDEAERIGRRIQGALGDWGAREGLNLGLTIGLGQAPDQGTTLEALLASVDRALYQSKISARRGGVCRVEGQ